ncbi:MAG: Trk family potassium uptake protein [Clostridiales bacterium]|jgi:trk system potassium uptake protein TrkH|nr:Trk family potassium uptake protein [Clostridiales bacterium]
MKTGYIKLKTAKKRNGFLPYPRLVALSFVVVILLGALVLMLPAAKRAAGGLTFIDALFTATSAVCVTGLSSVSDIAVTFTVFGQVVILVLIQIGGLGFMTLTSSFFVLIGRRLSLRERTEYASFYAEGHADELKHVFRYTLIFTFAAEALGAILLSAGFAGRYPPGQSVWFGLFHSVSAFCNAGFDIIPEGTSMASFNQSPLILLTMAFLVIAGGIGFIVVADIVQKRSFRKLRTDSKIVLLTSAALIVLGTVVFMFNEYTNENTIGQMGFFPSLLNAFFHSVCMRTAGFSTVALESMRPVARSVSIFLMFVGASPGSTGGGIKTATFFVLLVWMFSSLRRKKYTLIDKKRVGGRVLSRAAAILILALLVIMISQAVLLVFEPHSYEELLYEVVSAYSTVGYSLSITDKLTLAGKLVIIFDMFLGRVGMYTILLAGSDREDTGKIRYQELDVMM